MTNNSLCVFIYIVLSNDLSIIYYYIVGIVPSPVNLLTDTVPQQVKMNTCPAYGVINTNNTCTDDIL